MGALIQNSSLISSRFLHSLLLSIAYRYALSIRRKPNSACHQLERRCIVWKNGISWTNSDNITTLVELLDNNRWLFVAMSCSKMRPIEHAKLRSSLISLVRHLHQNHCPRVEVCECLISPSFLHRYPFNRLPDTSLFDMEDVALSILHRKPSISSQNQECIGRLSTKSLPLEPYHLLSPSTVRELFDISKTNRPVPASVVLEVQQHYKLQKDPILYQDLRENLNKLSLFAGRNPFVSLQLACMS